MKRLPSLVGLSAVAAFCVTPATAQVVSRFQEPLEEALVSMAMSLADVSFRTDHVERDHFRLRRTDLFAREPLSFADSLAAFHETTGRVNEPAGYIPWAADWLDAAFVPVLPSPVKPLLNDTTPPAKAFNRLISALELAATTVRESRNAFTEAESESLLTWSEEILSEGDGPESGEQVDIFAQRAAELASFPRSRERLSLASRWNSRAVFEIAHCVAVAAWELRAALAERGQDAVPLLPQHTWNTALGRVRVGGAGRDEYSGAYALIVDLGGEDTYRPDASGLNGAPVQVIIDLGGDDTYRGHIGAAAFGISLALDADGNDSYLGEGWTQGAARFGVGVLWDERGNDTYVAQRAAQGAGVFGIGIARDGGGNDLFRVGNYGQGIGATGGIGILDDRGGNDSYYAGGEAIDVLRYYDHYLTMAQGVGTGVRPVASGGFGFLLDRAGNDAYTADVYGQGTGYWLGGGGLVDGGGHDRYTAHQYAQGAGVHLASGALLDFGGNDVYAIQSVGQGCGHDLSGGLLFDGSGDDAYVSEGLSLGAGNANGISLFVDMSGSDAYAARRSDTMGYSDMRREYGMIGIMLDLAGEDRYATPSGGNGRWWNHSTYGAGTDREVPPLRLDSTRTSEAPLSEGTRPRQRLAASPESLFVQASNPISALQYLVEPAETTLVAMGSALTSFWAEKLGSESARERWAVVRIHQKLFNRGDTSSVPMLIDSLAAECGAARRMAAHLLGFSRSGTAVLPLVNLIRHRDWKTRQASAESLWRLKDVRAENALVPLLRDTIDHVRRTAAMALGTCGTSISDGALIASLSDESQIVRYAAEQALTGRATARMLLRREAESGDEFASVHALRALRGDTTDTSYVPLLRALLVSDRQWAVRAEAANSAAALRAAGLLSDLQDARRHAQHPFLKESLDGAIAALRTTNRGDE